MDCRPIKRARVNADDNWPYLFDITDLAKLVFAYVPKMQCRRFVRDSTGILQYNICSWMPQQDIDLEIQLAILKADNVLCLPFLSLHLSSIVKYPLPNLLPQILLHRNVDFCLVAWFIIPQCNLQLIAPQWPQPELHRNIRAMLFQKSPNFEALTLLLRLLTTPIEIGDLRVPLDRAMWSFLQPFLNSGLLTTQLISNKCFALMSLDVFNFVPKSTYCTPRHDQLLGVCIELLNWNVANAIWNPQFAPSVCERLTRAINTTINDETRPFQAYDDGKFGCWMHWKVNHVGDFPLQPLESAFEFMDSLPTQESKLKDVIYDWTKTFLTCPSTTIAKVFEQACIAGHINIIGKIWHCFSESTMLKQFINLCRFCDNLVVLEFAWSEIEVDIRNDGLRWMRCAFSHNNTVLWKFLFDKTVLQEQMPFAHTFEIENTMSIDHRTFIHSLGSKPVAMLSTIWDVPGVQDVKNVDGIVLDAFYVLNFPVFQFLNDKNARLSQSSLKLICYIMCSLRLHNLLSQVESDVGISNHCLDKTYAKGPESVRETLWPIAPLKDLIHFLDTADVTLDGCIFLLRKKAIDAQTLINTLQKNTTHAPLLDEIRAYTHCIVDEESLFF